MTELIRSVAAAGLWLGVFTLLVAVVDRIRGVHPLDGTGVLIGYPLFGALQIVALELLGPTGLLGTTALTLAHLGAVVAGLTWLARTRARAAAPASPDGSATPTRLPDPAVDADGPSIRRIGLATVGVTVGALAIFALVTPPHVWDVQAYHMPMVAHYVQNGSLDAWPAQDLRQVVRVNGGELQMTSVALLARSDAVVALPNLLALVVALVATFQIARLLTGKDAPAWLATVLVLTAPQILLGSVTAKNDVVFMALTLCAFYWTLRVALEPGTHLVGRLALAALAAGTAVATKVMGLNVLGTVGLVLLVLSLRRRVPARAAVVFGAIALASVLALAGDVYWQNLQRAEAVPVGTMPGEVHFVSGLANLVAAARFYLYDLGFRRLVTPQIVEHDFSHYGYFFPFLLALGSVAAVRATAGRDDRRRGVRVLALLGSVLFASVIAVRRPIQWDQRFMIWMVPTLAVLSARVLARLRPPSLLVAVSFAAAFSLGSLFLVYTDASDGLFTKSGLHLMHRGELASLVDVPSRRFLAKIDGFAALDRRAAPGDSVLYVGAEDTWMYPAWGRRFARHVRGVYDAEDAGARVAEGVFRFVVIEDDAAESLRVATRRSAEAAGYRVLVDADGRVIFERPTGPAPPASPPSPSRP
jgi:hypothetical protein